MLALTYQNPIMAGRSGVVMDDRKPIIDITEVVLVSYPSWTPYLATKARAQALVLKADKAVAEAATGPKAQQQ